MTSLSDLWAKAQKVSTAALRRADADINGTSQARASFESMDPGERVALQEVVVDRYGEAGWDDYMTDIKPEGADK